MMQPQTRSWFVIGLASSAILSTLALMTRVTAKSLDGWTYEGATGPDKWAKLKPEYSACCQGKNQSPIDIPATSKVLYSDLILRYGETLVTVVNKGYTIEVQYDKGSSLELAGKPFELVQFHFHAPSEHKINGQGTAMEMHLVHQSADGSLAVLGVMLELGAENPTLTKFWNKLPASPDEAPIQVRLNSAEMLPAFADGYYSYDGSLTTPPCSEGVLWYVMKQPISMSSEQLDRFLASVGTNARPVQPLNQRTY